MHATGPGHAAGGNRSIGRHSGIIAGNVDGTSASAPYDTRSASENDDP
jgi:hypothetical protein